MGTCCLLGTVLLMTRGDNKLKTRTKDNSPTQAKGRLEWATRHPSHQR
jgi:hypothetical protein